MSLLISAGFICFIALLILALLLAVIKQHQSSSPSAYFSSSPAPKPDCNIPILPLKLSHWRGQTARRQPAASPKQSELISLLNGDRNSAQRLLSHAKQNNPGRSESWCIDKVIADLVRDRR